MNVDHSHRYLAADPIAFPQPRPGKFLRLLCRDVIEHVPHAALTARRLDFLLHNAGFSNIHVGEVEFLTRPANWWLPFARVARHWWAFRFFRTWRRLEVMAELGPQQGRAVPLSLNLLGIARKPA